MQAAKINSLLELIDINNKNKPKIKSIDFLFQLLKNIDDKNLKKELILKSNLTKKEKSHLLKIFLNNSDISKKHFFIKTKFEIPQEEFKFKKSSPKINLPHEEFKKINEKKFNVPKEEFKFKKTKTIFPLHREILKSLLHDNLNYKSNDKKLQFTILQLPKSKQFEIITEIKKILTSKSFQNKTIKTLITLKKFKNAENIEDILNLTKKFNLNLSKIIFSHETFKEKTTKNFKEAKNFFNNIHLKNNNNIEDIFKSSKKNNLITLKQLIKDKKQTQIKNPLEITKKKHKEELNAQLQPNEIKHKIITAKQTLKHFTTTLKEAVENYKPPISKLTLELHPKEIGKVEVTIKQRGENLQVQISTNNQTTINFLTSQQQELKNNLVNMGFTNINMDFNSNNQQKKQNHQQKQNQYQNITEDNEELIIDFSYKYA